MECRNEEEQKKQKEDGGRDGMWMTGERDGRGRKRKGEWKTKGERMAGEEEEGGMEGDVR